jgi:hypothetical protein
MKKVIMALMVLGSIHYSATAQSNSKWAKNYKVCHVGNTYQICDKADPVVVAPSPAIKVSTTPMATPCEPISMSNTYGFAGYSRTPQGGIRASYEGRNGEIIDVRAPYHGDPSRQYDGPEKNEYRNLNYQDNTMTLPPSDGANR